MTKTKTVAPSKGVATRQGRTRTVTSINAKAAVPEALAKQVVDTYLANKAQNAAGNVYKKTRAALLGAMQAAGRDKVSVTAEIPGDKAGETKQVVLEAEVEAKESTFIDVAALLKLVPMDAKLIEVLGINVSDVEKLYGKATLARVIRVKTAEPNVSVGTAK